MASMGDEKDDSPQLQLTIHPDAIAAPAHRAAAMCREVVDLYFDALAKADLSQAPQLEHGPFFRTRISGPEMSAEERRNRHEHWVLAKAFQDLLRGVRGSLEEAYFCIQLLTAKDLRFESAATLDEALAPFRKKARELNFPDLMERINRSIGQPVAFADAYSSMQMARNCLEHRDGTVTHRDVGEDNKLRLRFPRLKAFVEQHGKEIEIHRNYYVEEKTVINFKIELRELEFGLGERLKITPADFEEIAYACIQFGSQLAEQVSKMTPHGL